MMKDLGTRDVSGLNGRYRRTGTLWEDGLIVRMSSIGASGFHSAGAQLHLAPIFPIAVTANRSRSVRNRPYVVEHFMFERSHHRIQ